MTKYIEIQVTKAALTKIDKAGIKYIITNENVNLEELLSCYSDYSELNWYDQSVVITWAKKAITLGKEYGIQIETISGRNNQDERCYDLDEVNIVAHDHPDCRHTVTDMLKA